MTDGTPTVQTRKVYTITETAAMLGISRQHCAELIRRGEIPGALKLGTRTVVRRAVLDAWLAGKDGESFSTGSSATPRSSISEART